MAALMLGLLMLACSATAPGNAPNVVIVLVDDVGWGQLGYNGDTYHQTPNIDRLAAEGLVMDNAYAASPVCSPTRASLLTGRHPARLHLTLPLPVRWSLLRDKQGGAALHNLPLLAPLPVDQLAPEEVTLAERFADAGWATGLVGKWHLGSTPGALPEEQGFGTVATVGYTAGPWSYYPPYPGLHDLDHLRPGEYLTDRLTREAVGFIEAHADEPFFLLLSHFAIHPPHEAKPELLAYYEARTEGRSSRHQPVLAAMLQSVDESVGTLLATLERLDLEERTLVLFLSDNGALARRPRLANEPLRGGKASLWEGGIRVPLILRWPGVIAPGGRSELPVSSVDLFPTLLELTGLPPDSDRPLDGRSFASLVKGGEAPEPRPLYFYHPHYTKLGPSAAIRDGSLKLVYFFGRERFLYDLDRDPGESHDLAALRPADADRLEAELFRWLDEVGADLPQPNPDYQPTRQRW